MGSNVVKLLRSRSKRACVIALASAMIVATGPLQAGRPRGRRRRLSFHSPRAGRHQRLDRRCRGGLGQQADRSDPVQAEVRAGRGRVPQTALAILSKRCKSCAAATPSVTCWSTWSIATRSSRARRRTRPPRYRSCRGEVTAWSVALTGWKSNAASSEQPGKQMGSS